MPAWIRRALVRRKLLSAYRARPPYQRNDYIGWIVGARRDATREARLSQMLEELEAGDRYMKMAWRPARASSPAAWRVTPDEVAVRSYLARIDLPLRFVATRIDALVRTTIPDVDVGMKWNVPFYVATGPVCYLSAARTHVALGFLHGTRIRDPSGTLVGTGKTTIRKAVFRSPGDFSETTLARLLREAKRIDDSWKTA